jgi:hypothetical protein
MRPKPLNISGDINYLVYIFLNNIPVIDQSWRINTFLSGKMVVHKVPFCLMNAKFIYSVCPALVIAVPYGIDGYL